MGAVSISYTYAHCKQVEGGKTGMPAHIVSFHVEARFGSEASDKEDGLPTIFFLSNLLYIIILNFNFNLSNSGKLIFPS